MVDGLPVQQAVAMSSVSSVSQLTAVECRDCGQAASLPSADSAHMLHALRVFVARHEACSQHVVVSVQESDGQTLGLSLPRQRDES